MILRKAILYICLLAAAASLFIGFLEAGKIELAWTGVIPAAALLFSRKASNAWLAPLALIAFVGLAVAGVLLRATTAWMVICAAAALAAWDLANLERSLGNSLHPRLEKMHLRSLLFAIGLGVLLALAGRSVNLTLPFIVMLLLVFLGLFSLDRLSRYLSERSPRKY